MADLQEYKCPACGGALEFDAKLQKMKCPYCDSEFELSDLQQIDESLNEDAPADGEEETWSSSDQTFSAQEEAGMKVYVCKSCGGEIVGDANTAATSCPYCGNPIVMMGQFRGELKPDLVIPFKLNKDQAMEAYSNHLKGKKLLPNIFKDQNRIKEIQGVYVPFWLFDCEAEGSATYEATKVRRWSDDDYDYEETSYYNVARRGGMTFENVPADGSSKMDDTLMQSLEPFDTADAVPFQTAYLAGYVADKYDVTKEETIQIVDGRIKNSAKEYLDSTVRGYDGFTTRSFDCEFSDANVKYAMYPVWMLSTKYNDESYTFAMNGQTGKFVGDLPVDKGKYWKRFIGSALIGALITFLIAYFAMSGVSTGGIIATVVVGLLVGLLSASAAKASMKSVRPKMQANEYMLAPSLSIRRDIFRYTDLEKTPRPKQENQS